MEAINSWFGHGRGPAPDSCGCSSRSAAAACLFAYGISLLVASATDPVDAGVAEVTAPAAQGRESRTLDLGWFVRSAREAT